MKPKSKSWKNKYPKYWLNALTGKIGRNKSKGPSDSWDFKDKSWLLGSIRWTEETYRDFNFEQISPAQAEKLGVKV